MSQREVPDGACVRFEELSLRAAGGAELSASARAELETHREQCVECREAERLFGALAHRPEAPAVAPLHDLAAQRLVNELLAQVDTAPAVGEGEAPAPADQEAGTGAETEVGVPLAASRKDAPARRGRSGWRWIAAVAAAVGILALGLPVLLHRAGRHTTPSNPGDGAVEPRTTVAYGRLLLRSGDIRGVPGAFEIGAPLGATATLEVGEGLVALQLRQAVTLRVERASRVALEPAAAEEAVLRLERGSVLAVVTPGLPGARFLVRTPHGSVRVTGTLFAVSVREGASEVEVLHGSVQITATGHPPVILGAVQRARIGAAEPEALSDAARRRLHRRADALALLTAEGGAPMRVTSQPEGAEVQLDGALLGRTPLSASVRPGHRRLVVHAPGHEAVTEHLVLAERSAVQRDFELRPLGRPPDELTPGTPSVTSAPGALPASRAQPRPRAVRGTIDEGWRALLAKAQTRRTARDWAGAAQAYRALIRRYPDRPEARTALVSLGFLLLDHLDEPTRALAAFGRYLRGNRSGPLAREAAWGHIRALRALGRTSEERRALEDFLRRYPRSVQKERIRTRLRQLATPGPAGGVPPPRP